MANEITVNCGLQVRNGNLKSTLNPGQFNADQAVARGPTPGCVNIGTTEEVIALTELATLGVCQVTNLDATNFVDIGPESAGAMVAAWRIKPGETWQIRLVPGTTYRAKADTAAVNIVFSAFND